MDERKDVWMELVNDDLEEVSEQSSHVQASLIM